MSVRREPAPPPGPLEVCPRCDVQWKKHKFCDSCGIAVGDGHLENKLYPRGGNQVCRWCMVHGYTKRMSSSEYTG